MPRKSEQETEIVFFELIDEINTKQRLKRSFLEIIDESSTKAWLKWAKNEEKKRIKKPSKYPFKKRKKRKGN